MPLYNVHALHIAHSTPDFWSISAAAFLLHRYSKLFIKLAFVQPTAVILAACACGIADGLFYGAIRWNLKLAPRPHQATATETSAKAALLVMSFADWS